MKLSRNQKSQRSTPSLTTRSRREQQSTVIKEEKLPASGRMGILNQFTHSPESSEASTVPKISNVRSLPDNTPSGYSSSPPNENYSGDDIKSTRLPSIANILREDPWQKENSVTYSRRRDPFYSGYSSQKDQSSYTETPKSDYRHPESGEPIDANTAIGAETLSQLMSSQGSTQLPAQHKFKSSPPDQKAAEKVTSNKRGGVKINMRDNSKDSTKSPDSDAPGEIQVKRSQRGKTADDLLPEVKSKSKVKIEGTHTFQSTQNKQLRKEQPKRDKKIKRWTHEEDQLIIYQKETLKKSWKEIEAILDSKHSWQAIQMRYLRCHKSRNSTWRDEHVEKLLMKIQEDFDNRVKRISVEMGPSFSSHRIANKINELATVSDNVLLRFYASDDVERDEDDDMEGEYGDEENDDYEDAEEELTAEE